MAVGGRSPSIERLTDGLCTKVCVSVFSLGATEGAMVEAIDIVRWLSPLVEFIVVVLVCAPGAGVYPG